MSYYSHMPQELIEQITEGKCILFVGAGISKKCITDGRKNLPDWYEFLHGFIKWIDGKRKFDEEYIRNLLLLLKEKKYLIVAEELLENVDTEEFRKYLQESFTSENIVPSRLHKLIAMIPFRGIITTNYDNLIELSLVSMNNKLPKVFTNNDILNGSNPLEKDFFIFKMHGDIEEPESIVLSYKSYLKMMFDSPVYQSLNEEIFSKYTILFIGYGNSDNNIEFILDRLAISESSKKHYILSEEKTFSEIEKKRYKKDRNLEIIEYVDYFKLHNHVDTFFDDIVNKLIEQSIIKDYRPRQIRTSIQVFFDDSDLRDGIYLRDYIFKEGGVTRTGKKYSYSSIENIAEFLMADFTIFYFGHFDFSKENDYLNKINLIINSKEEHECNIIFVSLEKNKKNMNEKYRKQTIFYVKENFIDSDLEIMRQYILDRMRDYSEYKEKND